MMPNSSFLPVNHLWKYRKRMNFSQKQVAHLLGHRRTTQVSRYEKGGKVPSLVTGLKLEIIYRAPVAFLYPDLYRQLKAEIRTKEEALRHHED